MSYAGASIAAVPKGVAVVGYFDAVNNLPQAGISLLDTFTSRSEERPAVSVTGRVVSVEMKERSRSSYLVRFIPRNKNKPTLESWTKNSHVSKRLAKGSYTVKVITVSDGRKYYKTRGVRVAVS